MLRKLLIICIFLLKSFCSFEQEKDSISYAIDTAASENKYDDETQKEDDVKVLFNDVYNDTSFLLIRTPINDTIARFRNKEEYQYPIIVQQKNKTKNTTNNYSGWDAFFRALSSSTAKFIFWTIVIGFMIVVIVLYAMDNNIRLFARKSKKVATAEIEISYNNIFDIDYASQINSAINNSNFNVATRLGFLQLITLLSNNKLITYGIEKTNFDYQFQLMNTKYYKNFMLSAYSYEYAWYSGYEVNENQYKQIAAQYKNLEEQLTDK